MLNRLSILVLAVAAGPRWGQAGNRSRCQRQGRRVWAVAVTILLTSGLLTAADIPAPGAQVPAESFKAFVASPPVIEALAWAMEWPGVRTNYHFTRYQSNAVFHGTGQRPLTDDSPCEDYLMAVGRFQNTICQKKFSHFYAWTNRNIAAERSNTVEYGHALAVDSMAWVLNLGCDLANPGTIRWSENSFVVTNHRRGVWLSGILGLDEQQRAARLKVEVRRLNQGRSGPPDQILTRECIYARPLSLSYLPSEIWASQRTSAGKDVMLCLKIFEIRTGELMLAENQFAFPAAHIPPPEQLLLVSNEFLVGWHDGRVSVSPDPQKAALQANHMGSLARRLYFGLALGALAFGPLVFWLGRKWVSRGTPARTGLEPMQ